MSDGKYTSWAPLCVAICPMRFFKCRRSAACENPKMGNSLDIYGRLELTDPGICQILCEPCPLDFSCFDRVLDNYGLNQVL